MLPGEIHAIVHGYHGDPRKVLGPQQFRPGEWEVRAFLPHAERLSVVLPDGLAAMEREDPAGFFSARLPGAIAPYRLRLTNWQGQEQEIDDPYRFENLLSSHDLHLFLEGTNYESWNSFGAHVVEIGGVRGTRFAVWAPNAESVQVCGGFNHWDKNSHPMMPREGGVWELFVPGVGSGEIYKYFVRSRLNLHQQMKADPYAAYAEVAPRNASVVWASDGYAWGDGAWLAARANGNITREPVAIYEVHLESWMHGAHNQPLSYRELAERLVPYVKDLGYTHIELMPILEHPFSGSWGYQVTGYFAPTSRFGTPDDFKHLVDACHQAGIGVILDWVPAHFPKDAHGLALFDGSRLYEHEDPRKGEQRDWGTLIFNFGRNEVKSFLLSSAMLWLKEYHIDGLRVDAVASMLYLDYSRDGQDWVPNAMGGRENLEAIEFLRRFNEVCHSVPGAFTAAEESTDFPGVTRPVFLGGLGFTFKWNMGWMHDMFRYFRFDPFFRRYHQQNITFSLYYAFNENYLLPVSHDEVVHGKSSLIGKMPGDEWRRFANARAFLAYMYGHPGKKLLFMGQEFGQYEEWSEARPLRWELLQYGLHSGLQSMVRDLNRLLREEPPMHEVDAHHEGFEWIDFNDTENSVIAFIRYSRDKKEMLVFVCNFTPVARHNYHLGAPLAGRWTEILNTDDPRYGGSGVVQREGVMTEPVESHFHPQRFRLMLPPLGVIVLKPETRDTTERFDEAPLRK
ncbi:MAG: 1,4-alpha-glucan branching protein GlgB [Acidobacteriota bacterium]